MSTIKTSKDQDLALGVSKSSKGKKKDRDSKQPEKKKQDKPKISDGGSNLYKDKKGKENTKCTYFHKGWHLESECMKKTIDMMV